MKGIRTARKFGITLAAALAGLGAVWLVLPAPPLPLEDIAYSQCVFDRNGRLLRVALSRDEKYRIYTPLDRISPDLIEATLLHEDRYYWRHPGVNPAAALRSAWNFAGSGVRRGGASTVSMQLARIHYRLHTRTAGGKLVQMVRAMQLERHYTKSQLLEAYLNLAPYGRNIEGVGAASLLYFGKPASRLSTHEAVALSVIPQSPLRRTPRADVDNPALTAAAGRLYSRLLASRGEGFSEDEAAAEFQARSDATRIFAAPHFVFETLREHPGERAITTTLDLSLQQTMERRIATYLESTRALGITNAAAMLIDSRTMEVLAHAGSAAFFDSAIHGQVDGARSRRSPGSTLKPFIYALAIDRGLIHPLSLVKDTPRSFGGYNPENFDREFAGPIRAGEALARSRNVPAVTLASQLVHPTFYEFLKHGGVALPRSEGFYGLALPLGGGEVTMEELVRLYAALANGGRVRPLRRTTDVPAATGGTRLFSPEAAFLTLQMLGEAPRPGLSEGTGSEGIYWKTGTSHGFRDAWSVAIFDRFVLAVWLGNFDGRSNPSLIGRSCAGPLLFSIIDAVRPKGGGLAPKVEPPAGANLKCVEFCAVSGQLPGSACAHRVTGWFVPGVSAITPCEVHREVLVDVETGLRVPKDDGTRAVRRETYEFWPSDLLALFEQAGLPRRRPPPFLPGTGSGAEIDTIARAGRPPQILSPQPGHVYALRGEDGAERSLPLRAQTEPDVARLYWFAGKTFLGAVSASTPLLWHPSPGSYKVIALDDHGRAGAATVTLQAAN